MKVSSVISARAIWLFETRELNPRGLDLVPVWSTIKSRYAFSLPTNRDEIESATDGIKFQHGTFASPGADGVSVNFTIFEDGLVAETFADTVVSELFLDDLVTFLSEQHGLFYEPPMVRKRRYASQLLVETSVGLSKISEAVSTITSELKASTGREFTVTGLTLGFDSNQLADGIGSFSVERRSNLPFSTNRYFCTAPLSTSAHVSLLEQFEAIMA